MSFLSINLRFDLHYVLPELRQKSFPAIIENVKILTQCVTTRVFLCQNAQARQRHAEWNCGFRARFKCDAMLPQSENQQYGGINENTEPNWLGLRHEIVVEKSLALRQSTHHDVLVLLRHLFLDVLFQPTQQKRAKHLPAQLRLNTVNADDINDSSDRYYRLAVWLSG